MKRYKFDYCVTTNTVQGYPYVDMVQGSTLGVAIGGCGQAAKSSDEIGNMAARYGIAELFYFMYNYLYISISIQMTKFEVGRNRDSTLCIYWSD